MNRYPLNSRVIGAGSSSALSYVAAIQNLILQVAATASAIRVMRASQTFTLAQVADTAITRFFKAVQVCALDMSLTTKTYFMKYVEVAQSLVLSYSATARQRVRTYAIAAQALALKSTLTVRQWVKTYAAAVQNFAMQTASRYSRHTFANAAQRFMAVGALTTRVTRYMKVAQTMAIEGVTNARKAVLAAVNQAMALAYRVVATRRTAIHAQATRAMSLIGDLVAALALRVSGAANLQLLTTINAIDVATSPANSERTVEIANTSRNVVVPGESYETGV